MHGQNLPFEMQQLIAATGQSVGKQREHNEDSLLALTTTLAGNAANVPFGLYIVADGMGGHQFGEVASNAAVRVIAGQIVRKFHSYLFALPTQQPEESLQEIMENAVKDAHRVSPERCARQRHNTDGRAGIGPAGDHRPRRRQPCLCHLPAGRVEQLTHDHSLVKRLEELGHLNKEEAASFPHRNVLIRALGQGDSLDVDIFTIPFPRNGTLMLCSDGLWGVVAEHDILRSLTEAPNLQRACQNMVSAANIAGGPDNISVVLVQMIG